MFNERRKERNEKRTVSYSPEISFFLTIQWGDTKRREEIVGKPETLSAK